MSSSPPTFRLAAPARAPARDATGSPTPEGLRFVSGSIFAPPAGTTPVVLIAEDHPDSRDALRALLEASGYRVQIATDGREAVERALAVQPDLVLMDIMMPNMDGLEATRVLRRSAEFRQVPIVALTAMEGARERAMEAGCDDYLTKPIDVPAFFQTIQGWLRSGRAAGS